MRRTVWLAGLALALAGIAAFVLLSTGDADERGERGRGSQSESEASESSLPAELAAAEEEVDPNGSEALALSSGDAEPQRVSTVESADLVTVRLRPDGGLPSGERANVYVVTGSRARSGWDRPRRQLRKRARRGELHRSDLEGRAFIPSESKAYVLAAETSSHWGFARVEPEARHVELPLARYPKLEVRVLDHAGNPAPGVTVDGDLNSLNLEDAVTDAQGVARWSDVHALISEERLEGLMKRRYVDDEPKRNCQVELRGPFFGRFEQRFALWEVGVDAEPLELQLPPCGSIEVQLVHASGRPWSVEKGAVHLQTDITGLQGAERPTGGNRTTRYAFEGSSVVLPWVEVGRSFELRLSADRMNSDEAVDVVGPTKPGERVVVRIQPAEAMRILQGRLVDESGEPLERERFELTLLDAVDRGRRSKEIATIRTDLEGRFREQIPENWPLKRPTLAEFVWRDDPALGVRIALPVMPTGRDDDAWLHDAGTLALEEAPLIVAGNVLDAHGKGVRRARVHIYAPQENGDSRRVAHRDVWTDRRGRFSLHGWAMPGAHVIVSASDNDYVTRKVKVPLGAQDVVIPLVAVGALVVEARLGPGVSRSELSAWCRSLEGNKRLKMKLDWDGDPDQAVWHAKKLEPGTYEAGLNLLSVEESVASLGPVVIEPEGSPRLVADLTDELYSIEISAESLSMVEGQSLRWREADGESWHHAFLALSNADTVIVSRTPSIDLELSAYGFRKLSERGVSGSYELRPEPGVPLRLLLPGAASLMRGRRFELLIDDLDMPWPRSGEPMSLDAQGEVTARLGPGRYKLEVQHLEGNVLSEEFLVRDSDEEQVIVLERLAADIARALSDD